MAVKDPNGGGLDIREFKNEIPTEDPLVLILSL